MAIVSGNTVVYLPVATVLPVMYNLSLTRSNSPAIKRSRVDDDEAGDESVSGGRLGVPSPDSIRVTQVSVLQNNYGKSIGIAILLQGWTVHKGFNYRGM